MKHRQRARIIQDPEEEEEETSETHRNIYNWKWKQLRLNLQHLIFDLNLWVNKPETIEPVRVGSVHSTPEHQKNASFTVCAALTGSRKWLNGYFVRFKHSSNTLQGNTEIHTKVCCCILIGPLHWLPVVYWSFVKPDPDTWPTSSTFPRGTGLLSP